MGTGIFTSGDCGKHKGTATSDTGLQPGNQVQINGNTDLSSCITGPDGAAVYSITLNPNAGVYDFTIVVVAQGPSGFGSGSLYLHFTDESGDTYKLWIYSGRKEQHTVSYNSKQPNIKTITWSD